MLLEEAFDMEEGALPVQDTRKEILHNFPHQLLLEQDIFADIQHDADHGFPAVLRGDLPPLVVDPHPCTVLADDTVLDVVAAVFVETVIDCLFDPVPVLRLNDPLHFLPGRLHEFIVGIPQIMQHGVVYDVKGKPFFQIGAHDPAGQHGQHDIDQVLVRGQAQLPYGLPAVFDREKFFLLLLVGRGGHVKADDFPSVFKPGRGCGKPGLEEQLPVVFIRHGGYDAAVDAEKAVRITVLQIIPDLIMESVGDCLEFPDHQFAQLRFVPGDLLRAGPKADHLVGKKGQGFLQIPFYQIGVKKLYQQFFHHHNLPHIFDIPDGFQSLLLYHILG